MLVFYLFVSFVKNEKSLKNINIFPWQKFTKGHNSNTSYPRTESLKYAFKNVAILYPDVTGGTLKESDTHICALI